MSLLGWLFGSGKPNIKKLKRAGDFAGLIAALRYIRWGAKQHEGYQVNAEAVEALGELGDVRALEPLQDELEHAEEMRQTASALRDINPASAAVEAAAAKYRRMIEEAILKLSASPEPTKSTPAPPTGAGLPAAAARGVLSDVAERPGEANLPALASLSLAAADRALVIELAARDGQSIDAVAGELATSFLAMQAMGHDRDTLMQLALEELFRKLQPRSMFVTDSVQSAIEAPDSEVTLLASLTSASQALAAEVAQALVRPIKDLRVDDPFLQTLKQLKVDCYWRSPSCGRASRAIVFCDPGTR